MSYNRQAFLDMIAWSELGKALMAESDNGYNIIVGSTPSHPILFPTNSDGTPNYSDHPRQHNATLNSDAAGRYQLLSHWWVPYKKMLGLTDYSPASQCAVALQQIKERKALPDIDAGNIESAIAKCSNIWASLPGNSYGQHTNEISDLLAAYRAAGGVA